MNDIGTAAAGPSRSLPRPADGTGSGRSDASPDRTRIVGRVQPANATCRRPPSRSRADFPGAGELDEVQRSWETPMKVRGVACVGGLHPPYEASICGLRSLQHFHFGGYAR